MTELTGKTMKALWYNAPEQFEIREVPIPEVGDDDVLLKVHCCGLSRLQIAEDGKPIFTQVFAAQTNTFIIQQKKLYKVKNLSDEEATLLEPAACAVHGLDKLNPPVGVEVLLLGAGPTGLILAQLLKLNGASRVVIAANKGIKMDIAKQLDAGDEYIELDRQNPEGQWQSLKENNPYGFDVVVEATGVEKLANESINYVRRGGTLMIYGVYENKALVHWPPSKIFGDEIK
ncbi:hypothetical protein C0992_010574, partial [Termitomyces sp. T32_za158]